MLFRLIPAMIAVSVTFAGCAKKPESIAPAYVSPMTYSSYTCEQLKSEAIRIDEALSRASAQQNDARQSDTVGVILLGLPVSSLSGGNVADQIAYLKGHKDTIQQTQITSNCMRVVPASTAAPAVAPIMAVATPAPTPVAPSALPATAPASISALPPLPTQTQRLPGHRLVAYGCPGFAPRVLYSESPDKLPKNCERIEPL